MQSKSFGRRRNKIGICDCDNGTKREGLMKQKRRLHGANRAAASNMLMAATILTLPSAQVWSQPKRMGWTADRAS